MSSAETVTVVNDGVKFTYKIKKLSQMLLGFPFFLKRMSKNLKNKKDKKVRKEINLKKSVLNVMIF